ncbi:hypothetical protein SALBM311S_11891 [Streptomyces alboniger]
MLMKTKPRQVATFASGRANFSGVTWGKSQAQGGVCMVPSRFQAKPWNGQRNSPTLPPPVRSLRPRCRHALT